MQKILLLLMMLSCAEEPVSGRYTGEPQRMVQDLDKEIRSELKKIDPVRVKSVTLSDVVPHNIIVQAGGKPPVKPDIEKDTTLTKYIDSFVEDAHLHKLEINNDKLDKIRVVKFVEQFSQENNPKAIAVCHRFNYREKPLIGGEPILKDQWFVIEVHKEKAIRLTGGKDLLLKKILFHELTHCLLERGHLPKDQLGIMSAAFSDNADIETKWSHLVDDLFATLDTLPILED